MQPDTITPGGPQGLNRYSYVGSNPITFNDPSGHVRKNDEGDSGGPGCGGMLPSCGGAGGSSSNGNDNSEDTIPSFDDWVDYCSNNLLDESCSQPAKIADCSSQTIYYQTGGNSAPNGCHFDHFQTVYEWSNIDWLDIGVNGLSIFGNIVLVLGTLGTFGIGAGAAIEFYSFTQGVGVVYDISKVDNLAMTWDGVSTVVGKVSNDWDSVLPIASFFISVENIVDDIGDVKRDIPIYAPDVLIFPPPSIPPGIPPVQLR